MLEKINSNSNLKFNFYKMPKMLFTDSSFSMLSNEAKLLYCFFIDRVSLSLENGWVDAEGNVYISYTTQEAQSILNIGHTKCTKIFREIEDAGLASYVEQGLNKPRLIFPRQIGEADSRKTEVQKAKKKQAEEPQNGTQDNRKTVAINNNINNNNKLNSHELRSCFSNEVVNYAEKICQESIGVVDEDYTDGILNNWYDRKLFTLDQIHQKKEHKEKVSTLKSNNVTREDMIKNRRSLEIIRNS